MSFRSLPALTLGTLISIGSPPAAGAIYTVGVGTGCTHATLQEAINAAEANPGPDTIRVTRSLSYTQQALTINTAQHLSIVGGFATCNQAESDGFTTTISGAGGTAAPVFDILGQTGSILRFRLLFITGGDTAGEGHGGGIHYRGNGLLELIESGVSNNTAGYGGGIYADGLGSQAELLLSESVIVAGNTARFSGGGIYLNDMNMRMVAPGSILLNNTAVGMNDRGFGGGLIIRADARSARALIGSTGTAGLGTINGNSARYGGGIYGRPTAASISLQGFSETFFWNSDLLLNVAPEGAAAFLESDSALLTTLGARVYFNPPGDNLLRPEGALPCPVGAHCGLIAGNQTRDSANLPTAGAVFRLNSSAGLLAHVRLFGTPLPTGGGVEIASNSAGRLIDVLDDDDEFGARVLLRNAVLRGNSVSEQLLRASGDNPLVVIKDSTIAGNSIGAAQVLSVQGDFSLDSSLIWQPGKTVLSHSGGSRTVNWSLANEATSLGGGPGAIQIAGPRFIDPDRGDFRLRAASPAIDSAPSDPLSIGDADGRPRDVALPVPRSGLRFRDAGAYERQSIDPLVLNGDFDLDLNLWTPFSGGVASSWDGSQNAAGASGSGSLYVNQSNIPQPRVIIRRQCIHLPGPGRYRLNGWGRSGIGTAATRDSILLNWQLRRNGGESCDAGLADAGGDHLLTTANAWNRPVDPALIDLAEGDWSVNSSLTIALVVVDRGGTAPATATGWFDGVTVDFQPLDGMLFADGFETSP